MYGQDTKGGVPTAKCPSKSTSLMWPSGLAWQRARGCVAPLHSLSHNPLSLFARLQTITAGGSTRSADVRAVCFALRVSLRRLRVLTHLASSFLSHSMFSATSSIAPGSIAQPARGSSPLQHTPVAVATSTPSSAYESLLAPSAHPPSTTAKIWVHNEHYSKRDFLINPTFFPNLQPNDLFEVYDPGLPKELCKKLIIQWTGHDKDAQPVQV